MLNKDKDRRFIQAIAGLSGHPLTALDQSRRGRPFIVKLDADADEEEVREAGIEAAGVPAVGLAPMR